MAPKMTGRTNTIGNFLVDKVDTDTMQAFLKEWKVPSEKVDPKEEGEPLAVALSIYFRETISEDDLAKCSVCGGEGPAEMNGSDVPCAFCGNEEALIEDVDPTSTEQLAKEVEAEEPAPKKSKKKTPDQPEATNKKAKDKMTTSTAKDTTKTTSTALATTKGKGKKLAVVEDAILFTAADLDNAVERVEKCKASASLSYWALGNELRRINEDKLWKLRMKGGKAAYTSFDQFCETEAKISHTYAYSLIEVSKKFSEQDVAKFGTSKLTLMLKVADVDLPKVREIAAKPGTTKRQLAKEVAKVVEERGHGAKKSKQHAAAGKKGAKAKAAKRPTDKITIAAIEGTKRVKLYAKPADTKNIDWKALKRAKTPAALPFGRLELTNEVTVFISIVTTDDGLEAVVNVRRDVS